MVHQGWHNWLLRIRVHWDCLVTQSLSLQGPWAITQSPLHFRSILHLPRCVCPTICPPMLLQPLSRHLSQPALRTPVCLLCLLLS